MKPRAVIAIPLLAGLCACAGTLPRDGRAVLKHHSNSPTPTLELARYDRETGTCAAGTVQLLSGDEFRELTSSWQEAAPEGADCEQARVARMPQRTDYPVGSDGSTATGAAHVLVRLRSDGTLESAHAVCATGRAFGDAAESTALRLSYAPLRCGDHSLRTSFLLPLAYDPN